MRENTAAAGGPRELAFRHNGVRVEGGVRLYYLPSCDIYMRAEAFVPAAERDLLDYAERDRRARLRRPSERVLVLDARRRLAAEELAGPRRVA